MSFRCTLILAGVLLVAQAAPASVITFQQVPNGPLSTYTEAGFTASILSGSWDARFDYGNPAPFIKFASQDNQETTGAIQITGSPFTFGSVDLYSSLTPIPYTITGSLNTAQVFSLQGTIPGTFGNFATLANLQPNDVIDTLTITLTNPIGTNPMGLDNIVVTPAGVAVPEPGSIAFFSANALVLLVGAVLRKRRPGA